ncbi:LysR family transcriptional regulator [Marinovum sp.]|uniref:LysR family transcriptional regulator n=1 Tax=Marinovum sp. TaxID=2024839 RepID=UPI002B26CE61|nr:LysR family transcriptional regulator [Marinovum sp.]
MSQALVHRLKPAHLRLIRAIHDDGKLQLAAQAAGMSQPAASRLLSEIETDAGGPLFERLPKGMRATPMGAAFVRHARVILSEIDALSGELGQLRDGTAGVLRVGAVTGPAVGALVPALMALRAEMPDIQPTIEVAPSVTLIRGLEEGRFDFVLARTGSDNDTRAFLAAPGRREEVCLLVRGSHPLAGRRISLAETLDYEFVIQEPGSPIRAALETAFLVNRLPTPETVTNSSSLLVALSLLTGSDVIAPQTREVAETLIRAQTDVRILEAEEEIAVPPFLVLQFRHRQLSPVAQRVLDEVLRRL